MRRLASRLLLAAAATAVALGALALISALGLLPRKINDQLLEREVTRGADKRPLRVLVLGDSLLEFWPMKRCLRRDLLRFHRRQQLGLRVWAWGGTGPFEHRAHLGQATNGGYHPQLVIVFYNAGNDITDSMRNLAVPAPLVPKAASGWLRGAPMATPLLACNSDDYNDDELPGRFPDWAQMRKKGIDPELIRMAKNSMRHPDQVGDELVSAGLLAAATANDWLYIHNVLIEGHPAPQAWQVARKQLSDLAGYARLVGAEVALVMVPAMVQVSRTQEPFLRRARFVLRPEVFTSRRHQQRLLAWCKQQQQVTCLDLLPLLRAHPARQRLFLKRDDHLSELGHEVVFEAVAQRILRPWIARQQR